MCGIAGFCSFEINYMHQKEYWLDVLSDMRNKVNHRGKDNFGEYLD